MQLKEYDVTITETLQRTVTVQAESQQAAEDLVHDRWNDQAYVLDADDFVGVDFETVAEREAQAVKGGIDVLLVEPGKYPEPTTLAGDLKSLQAAVGGTIEVIYPFPDSACIVLNDEGKQDGLPFNRAARTEDGDIWDIYAGTFFVAGLGEENLISLTPEQMQRYEEMFHQPEMFLRMGQGVLVQAMPDDMVRKAADRAAQQHEKEKPDRNQPER